MILVDHNKLFPDQRTNGELTECSGITASLIAGDIAGVIPDPDFTYANTLRLEGVGPTLAGSDPLIAMQSIIFYGVMPNWDATFTALKNGELYVADYKNYSPQDYADARKHTQKGIKYLDTYQDIVSFIKTYKTGIAFPMHFYPSFFGTGSDGLLPDPQGTPSDHTAEICGLTDDEQIMVKLLLGPQFGYDGYTILTEERYNQIRFPYRYSLGFDPNANRTWSLIMFAAGRLNNIPLADLYAAFKA